LRAIIISPKDRKEIEEKEKTLSIMGGNKKAGTSQKQSNSVNKTGFQIGSFFVFHLDAEPS